MLYEKHQKLAFFRPNDHFVTYTPHFLGSKFEYYLTKAQKAKYTLYKRITLGMPNIERMMPAASDKGKPMARTDAVRHRTKVASHTVVPLGTANSDRWFAVPKGTAVWLATIV